MLKKLSLFAAITLILLTGCKQKGVHIAYEEYTLDNGLKVILHQDNSDPIVAQAITFHVGSAREKTGKTGFAHFFEHMLFQRSENLPRNAFFTKISDMGGDFNGGTSNDYTIYYEQVPRNALEKILWMESDRMGYFINTVTQSGLEREIDVICNEKRQTEVNNAYGMMDDIMCKEFYPKGHPYSWTVIGEFDDIKSATIEDVKEFYANYYVPSNATLCIAGDIDIPETKALIEKYFGEIPSHPVEKPEVAPVVLSETKSLYYEDQFATMPALDLAYSTTQMGHKDEAALDILAGLLGQGKSSPMYKRIVEGNLAPRVSVYNSTRERAGEFVISTVAYPDVDIDLIMAAIDSAYVDFETTGVDEEQMATLKAQQEARSYKSLSGILYKSMMLSRCKEFYGKADYFVDELEAYKAVTAEDVLRVYNQYIKGQNYVAVVAVPKGQTDLAVEGSRLANVLTEDESKQTMRSAAGAIQDDDYEHTPSKIDRSTEPDYMANTPQITVPDIWETTLANGIKVKGITNSEVPVVDLLLVIDGGRLVEKEGKRGTASINASMMNDGTALRTAAGIEQATKRLGATISTGSQLEHTLIQVSTLSENLAETLDILTEILTEPRYDEGSFARAVKKAQSSIKRQSSDIRTIASLASDQLYYGDCELSKRSYGDEESIAAITIEDVKDYFGTLSAANTQLVIAGDVTPKTLHKAAKSLEKWVGGTIEVPEITYGEKSPNGVYFVDFPGSKQSYIRIVGPGKSYNEPDYYKLDILNEKLGAGSNGRLFEVLRLQRGYTYGAYSRFATNKDYGYFLAQSSVQGSATKESVELFKQIFKEYGPEYTEEQLEATKGALLRSRASDFETSSDLCWMLYNIVADNLPNDYIAAEQEVLAKTTLEDIQTLAQQYLNPDNMIIVVVGDKATQYKNLKGAVLYNPFKK